jgi:hypothetical protein
MTDSVSAIGSGWTASIGQIDLQSVREQRLEGLFNRADADGVLSKAEFAAMHNQMAARVTGPSAPVAMASTDEAFSKADADGDGAITRDEFSAFLASMRPPAPAVGSDPDSGQSDPADADGDGIVSDEEYLAYYGVPRSDSSLDVTV